MYDPVCKFLVENFSTDFANWLLKESVNLSLVSPSELSLEPIRADAVILLESASFNQKTLLHIEFQTRPDPQIPFRMLDYWVRIYRRYAQAATGQVRIGPVSIRQVVIYLAPSQSERVYQTRFEQVNTVHSFEVIRLWEQPFEAFLASPGLLPFAVLGRVEDPVAALE
jgi:predicted transposase/invertase (TIGR01784 family)